MARPARVPRHLRVMPFRGSDAIAKGELTRAMLRGRSWRRLFRDIYAQSDLPLDHRVWCEAAALLLPPGGAIAGLSAAYLMGVDLLAPDAPVTVAVPRSRRVDAQPGLQVRYATLPATDVTRLGDIPLTSPLRTAFDLGRQPPLTEAVVALDALLHRRLVTLPSLAALVDSRHRWPGVPLLRKASALAEPLSESPMETRLRLLLVVEYGLPCPVAQYEVRDARGRLVARVDLAYPELRLALEYEGDHHRERAVFRRDVARLNALRAAGWTVLRFTADDVLRHPERIARQVAAVARTTPHEP